jgi:hypothetical protein
MIQAAAEAAAAAAAAVHTEKTMRPKSMATRKREDVETKMVLGGIHQGCRRTTSCIMACYPAVVPLLQARLKKVCILLLLLQCRSRSTNVFIHPSCTVSVERVISSQGPVVIPGLLFADEPLKSSKSSHLGPPISSHTNPYEKHSTQHDHL